MAERRSRSHSVKVKTRRGEQQGRKEKKKAIDNIKDLSRSACFCQDELFPPATCEIRKEEAEEIAARRRDCMRFRRKVGKRIALLLSRLKPVRQIYWRIAVWQVGLRMLT